MARGWIRLYRQIKDNAVIWGDEPYSRAQAWIDLLLRANYEDKTTMFNGKLTTVKRGSFITSIRKLASEWSWGHVKVMHFLEALEKDGMIKKESDNHRTLLIIVNYDLYQDRQNADDNTDRHADDNTDDTQLNNKRNKETKKSNSLDNPIKVKDKNIHDDGLSNTESPKPKKISVTSIIEERGLSDELKAAVTEWAQYKIEKRQGYKERGLRAFLSEVQNNAKEYGEENVIKVIQSSMASNYQGVTFDKLKYMKSKKTDDCDLSYLVV
jgi:hypothetical protein